VNVWAIFKADWLGSRMQSRVSDIDGVGNLGMICSCLPQPGFGVLATAYAQEIGWRYLPRADAGAQRVFTPDAATLQEWGRKPSRFFGGPGRQLMTAQFLVHSLDLPERTSFTAKDAR